MSNVHANHRSQDFTIRVYEANEGHVKEKTVLSGNRGMITALAFSPNGKMLAAGDSNRQVLVYDTTSNEVVGFDSFTASFLVTALRIRRSLSNIGSFILRVSTALHGRRTAYTPPVDPSTPTFTSGVWRNP
jgi:WD40 repeat protein